jgi:hypothetical protein
MPRRNCLLGVPYAGSRSALLRERADRRLLQVHDCLVYVSVACARGPHGRASCSCSTPLQVGQYVLFRLHLTGIHSDTCLLHVHCMQHHALRLICASLRSLPLVVKRKASLTNLAPHNASAFLLRLTSYLLAISVVRKPVYTLSSTRRNG